jgi:hypothetical protein
MIEEVWDGLTSLGLQLVRRDDNMGTRARRAEASLVNVDTVLAFGIPSITDIADDFVDPYHI